MNSSPTNWLGHLAMNHSLLRCDRWLSVALREVTLPSHKNILNKCETKQKKRQMTLWPFHNWVNVVLICCWFGLTGGKEKVRHTRETHTEPPFSLTSCSQIWLDSVKSPTSLVLFTLFKGLWFAGITTERYNKGPQDQSQGPWDIPQVFRASKLNTVSIE